MQSPTDARYAAIHLPPEPEDQDLRALVGPYQAIVVSQFRAILDRTERSEFYPWIDTKLDLITGKDFAPVHPLLRRDLICGWAQGRGLEALAGFADWLAPFRASTEADRLAQRARRVAADLLGKLREARAANGGHLRFYMTSAGEAIDLNKNFEREPLSLAGSPHSYSDLFCAKGMYAAASLLDDATAAAEARAFCIAVCRDIFSLAFRSDQPQPDAGARAWIPGAFSHGPAMIALGAAALLARFEPGPESVGLGLALARHVLDGHVNVAGKWPELCDLELVEFVDDAGRPYVNADGRLISDPGHALEFVGLFLKFSRQAQLAGGATESQVAALCDVEQLMPALLSRAFANGYRPALGGICKTVDLLTHCPVDDTMPWWSLPETIRAALGAAAVRGGDESGGASREDSLLVLARSHNAFVTHYLRPDLHLMAVKVRDGSGRVVDSAPSFPDADPGYHTALSLIDALDLLPAGQAASV